MVEKLYTGKLAIDEFSRLIENCHFSKDARVLAEQFPAYVIDDSEHLDLLRFVFFEPGKAEQARELANYTSGRIFQEDAELRWEKQDAMMRVVYLGMEEHISTPSAYGLQENQALSKLVPQKEPKRYYLFGERLKQEDISKMGKTASREDFAQVRIPRLLRYPLKQISGRYVYLRVREYIDTITGRVVLYRFQSLEAE